MEFLSFKIIYFFCRTCQKRFDGCCRRDPSSGSFQSGSTCDHGHHGNLQRLGGGQVPRGSGLEEGWGGQVEASSNLIKQAQGWLDLIKLDQMWLNLVKNSHKDTWSWSKIGSWRTTSNRTKVTYPDVIILTWLKDLWS